MIGLRQIKARLARIEELERALAWNDSKDGSGRK
jgi:hypothetical protein